MDYGLGEGEIRGRLDFLTAVGPGWHKFSHEDKSKEWVCFQKENGASEWKDWAILVKVS